MASLIQIIFTPLRVVFTHFIFLFAPFVLIGHTDGRRNSKGLHVGLCMHFFPLMYLSVDCCYTRWSHQFCKKVHQQGVTICSPHIKVISECLLPCRFNVLCYMLINQKAVVPHKAEMPIHTNTMTNCQLSINMLFFILYFFLFILLFISALFYPSGSKQLPNSWSWSFKKPEMNESHSSVLCIKVERFKLLIEVSGFTLCSDIFCQ